MRVESGITRRFVLEPYGLSDETCELVDAQAAVEQRPDNQLLLMRLAGVGELGGLVGHQRLAFVPTHDARLTLLRCHRAVTPGDHALKNH